MFSALKIRIINQSTISLCTARYLHQWVTRHNHNTKTDSTPPQSIFDVYYNSIEYTVKTSALKTIFLRCWVQNNKIKISLTQKVSVQAFFLSDWCLIYMRSGTLVQWDFSVGRATQHNGTKCSDKKILLSCVCLENDVKPTETWCIFVSASL